MYFYFMESNVKQQKGVFESMCYNKIEIFYGKI